MAKQQQLVDENPAPAVQKGYEIPGRKCSFDEDDFTGCVAMDRALGDVQPNEGRKGLVPVFVSRVGSYKTTFRGLAYKVSGQDGGVFLNVCPWCREPILPAVTKDMEVADA